MYLVTHVSWECQSQKWGDRAVHTSLSPAQWKCQFAAKSISSGKINPQSYHFHGNSPTSLLTGWCTDMGNTVWFKYMKISACLALPHLQHKCPHKIDRQMKKCQSSKVLLVMVMAPVKWNVKCVVVCHCVCSCQSLLNIAITAGSPLYCRTNDWHQILSCNSFSPYSDILLLFQVQEYKFKCVRSKNGLAYIHRDGLAHSFPKLSLFTY